MAQSNFRTEQKKYSRVKDAYNTKENIVKSYFTEKNLDYNSNFKIIFRAFKSEGIFEVWVKTSNQYILLKEYPICSSSGELGPKRKQGDYQVPEGLYYIDRFNPYSNFYLSLGINYPNSSDKILGEKGNLGGDIFIHGSCVTIGCIPLTDSFIKEVYIIAVEAKSKGQAKIPVYIFPTRMSEANFSKIKENQKDNSIIKLWEQLKNAYNNFEKNKTEINFTINKNGDYIITD